MCFALYYNPIKDYSKTTLLLFLKVGMANIIGVILALLFIYVTGYNMVDIYNTIVATTGYIENSEKSALSFLATASAFLTPSLLFLVLFGCIAIYKQNKKYPKYGLSMLSLVLLSISPCFVVGFFPSYKFLITLFPMMLIIMAIGLILLIL